MQALEARPGRQSKLAVNLRVGQVLILQPEVGEPIHIELEAKHGQGGRLVVRAERSVKITTPDT